ncbi:hypothetical protein C4J81_00130 [Deltaproteobacteria bacterium Smac51]|nr:hypothetical protein C4J81_00130 [Deltaproteobacteria bacterium Smac51]
MVQADDVKAALEEGVRSGLFPGAVSFWGRPEDEPARAAAGLLGRSRDLRPVTESTIYDLASVTKILSTTSLAMILEARGLMDLQCPVPQGPLKKAAVWPSHWRTITPAHLLSHQSGLIPWLPLYRLTDSSLSLEKKRAAALQAIAQSRPEADPGRKTIYSDLNFILLGFLLESISGEPISRLFQREIARPLNLATAAFCPVNGDIAPTEDGFRCGGPIGHPDALWRGPVPLGRVHDDNAAWLGGAAGHAGLFSAAGDIWAIVRDWGRARDGRGTVFSKNINEFIKLRPDADGGGRALGFDLKAPDGTIFTSGTVGHLGYTGPSLWWDVEKDFAWLVLCNRVHPTARCGGIIEFRRRLMSEDNSAVKPVTQNS